MISPIRSPAPAETVRRGTPGQRFIERFGGVAEELDPAETEIGELMIVKIREPAAGHPEPRFPETCYKVRTMYY